MRGATDALNRRRAELAGTSPREAAAMRGPMRTRGSARGGNRSQSDFRVSTFNTAQSAAAEGDRTARSQRRRGVRPRRVQSGFADFSRRATEVTRGAIGARGSGLSRNNSRANALGGTQTGRALSRRQTRG